MDIKYLDFNKLSFDGLIKIVRELHDSEAECVELKDNYIRPSEISDYITQFSNNRGGLLILGMTNDGEPSGKIKSYNRENEISIYEGDLITNPPVNIEIKTFELTSDNSWIVAIKIPKPTDGIYRMSSKGALVKRVGTRRANIELTGNIYEGRILNNVSMELLDSSLVKQFISKW